MNTEGVCFDIFNNAYIYTKGTKEKISKLETFPHPQK